jgi:hypothetical protein
VRGRSRALLALALLILTGVALATPVPVLAISGNGVDVLRRLDEGEALTYSYRQSIYDVPVREEFVRRGDVIELLRVRSPDIRSIEYFRWDGDILQDEHGEWVEDAPASEHPELVIRITALGQQRIATPRWSVDLRERFGESLVTLRVGRRPLALAVLGGAS